MKKTILLIAFSIFVHQLLAQTQHNVSGVIKDTSGQGIIAANIWLIADKDTLHTISNETGKFTFINVTKNTFSLRISILGRETLYREFAFPEASTNIELPPITLTIKTSTLKEVVIMAKPNPVVIKEDTIEYLVDQYRLKENSVVEDLLKRLPGMQVDMDGNITVMGEKISKVRINGKDFLVSDIKSLTQLLPVDLIEKVQLIDDYGDMARATGRKTGTPKMVINLQTKAALNKIHQAQAIAGVGNNGKYNMTVLANQFSEKQMISINGNTNNVSTQGDNIITSTGTINYNRNYDNKLTINAGVQGGGITGKQQSLNNITTVTSDGTLYIANTNVNNNKSNNYTFTGGIDYNPDIATKINLNASTTLNSNTTTNQLTAIQSGFQRKDQVTMNNTTGRTPSTMGSLFASHKFKGKGSIISFNFSINKNSDNNTQESYDSLRYYNIDNSIAKDSLLHQLLGRENDNFTTNLQASYVKPLNTTASLEFKYAINTSMTSNTQETQWVDITGKIQRIDSLSNKYSNTTIQQQVEFNYRKNKGKFDYTLGARLQPSSLRSNVAGEQPTIIRSYPLVPVFNIQYKLARSVRITLNYTANVGFPSYQQLQPIPDYSNPQFPVIGNPDLQASIGHVLSIGYRAAGINTLFVQLTANYIKNNITTNTVLVEDSFNTVRQETHFLNTDGNYMTRFSYGWSRRLSDGKYNLFLDGSSSYSNNILYIQDTRKPSQNLILTQSARANVLLEWLELMGGTTYTYKRNVYMLTESNITNINTWAFMLSGKMYFLKTFTLIADANKQMNSGFSGRINTNPLMLNATLEKTLFKRKLTLRLQGYNLLDETSNLSQRISGNSVIENRNNILGRYFMLSLQCDLRSFKGE